jgi:hypothetical protein
MTENSDQVMIRVLCGECGALLGENASAPIETRAPCACGSRVRHFEQRIFGEINIQTSVRLLQKRYGVKRPLVEMFVGRDLRKSAGDFINKIIRIDRVGKRYIKHLSTDEGEVLMNINKPLKEHTGHGSDKPEYRAARLAKKALKTMRK